MNIPVYEVTQPQNMVKVTSGNIVFSNSGVKTANKVVKFYAQSDDNRRPKELPCNYKTLDKQTLRSILNDTQYGFMHVSVLGDNIKQFIAQ